MFCSKCGKEISDDSKFCKHCGSNIVRDVQEDKPIMVSKKKNPEKDLIFVGVTVIGLYAVSFILKEWGKSNDAAVLVEVLFWVAFIVNTYGVWLFLKIYRKGSK